MFNFSLNFIVILFMIYQSVFIEHYSAISYSIGLLRWWVSRLIKTEMLWLVDQGNELIEHG